MRTFHKLIPSIAISHTFDGRFQRYIVVVVAVIRLDFLVPFFVRSLLVEQIFVF